METKRKLFWVSYPAVSANRLFYVTHVNKHIWHVIFNSTSGLWYCQIDHVDVNTGKTAAAGKKYFQHIFDSL